jgi:hypothetical protein
MKVAISSSSIASPPRKLPVQGRQEKGDRLPTLDRFGRVLEGLEPFGIDSSRGIRGGFLVPVYPFEAKGGGGGESSLATLAAGASSID